MVDGDSDLATRLRILGLLRHLPQFCPLADKILLAGIPLRSHRHSLMIAPETLIAATVFLRAVGLISGMVPAYRARCWIPSKFCDAAALNQHVRPFVPISFCIPD